MIDVIDLARSQLGVCESGGPNRGEPFTRYSLPGEDPLPWCARFLRWVFAQAGHQLPGNPYEIASVASLQAALAVSGAWLGRDGVAPRRGDIVLFGPGSMSDTNRPGRHCGVIEEVSGPYIYSIEGNWGDAVSRICRRLDDRVIWGYARWPLPPQA